MADHDLDRQRIEAIADWLQPKIKQNQVLILPRPEIRKLLVRRGLLPAILSSDEVHRICERVMTLGSRLAYERAGITALIEADTTTGDVSLRETDRG